MLQYILGYIRVLHSLLCLVFRCFHIWLLLVGPYFVHQPNSMASKILRYRTSNSSLHQEIAPCQEVSYKFKRMKKLAKTFFTGLSWCPSAALFLFPWALNRISRLWLPLFVDWTDWTGSWYWRPPVQDRWAHLIDPVTCSQDCQGCRCYKPFVSLSS